MEIIIREPCPPDPIGAIIRGKEGLRRSIKVARAVIHKVNEQCWGEVCHDCPPFTTMEESLVVELPQRESGHTGAFQFAVPVSPGYKDEFCRVSARFNHGRWFVDVDKLITPTTSRCRRSLSVEELPEAVVVLVREIDECSQVLPLAAAKR